MRPTIMRCFAPLSLLLVAAAAPFGLAAGCGGHGAAGTATTSSSSTGGGGSAQSDACAHFIECSKQVQPDSVPGAEAAYGPSGACWTTESADACEHACEEGIAALHTLSPSSSACVCQSDADCGGATPACSAERGACVACTTSEQCQAPTPACDPATSTCVACASAADCHAPLPACDAETHTCVECTNGGQCKSGVCEADHTCCVAESPCLPTSCGTITDSCGKPVSCGGCGSGQYCDTQSSSCADITTTYACDANGSNNTCTKYEEYCQYYFAGPGTTAWCSPIPAQCQATPTCACLLAAHEYYPPDTCQEGTGPNGAGTVYVTSKP